MTVMQNFVDFFDFLVPIWESYLNREKYIEKPDYEYFTVHIELINNHLRFDLWCNDANFTFK